MSDTALPPSTEERPGAARAAEALFWVALAAGATALFAHLRGQLEAAHAALGYLLVILGGSSRLGRAWGVFLAVGCFLAFNYFLVPPYDTLAVREPLQWLVLAAFLLTGVVAAQLLDRAQREAAAARQRADEIERLSALGAETLNAAHAEDGVAAIARMLVSRLDLARCDVFALSSATEPDWIAGAAADGSDQPHPGEPLLAAAVARGALAAEDADGRPRLIPAAGRLSEALQGLEDVRVLVVPLRVRGAAVGLLRLQAQHPPLADAAARRFTEALAYYAALGVERVRLAAEAARGEALRESERVKDALLASVSHDLRTPLTTIKALAHEIASEGDERARVVEQEADRLNRFVSNLLDLSRLNGGAITATPELVPAEDLMGAALEQVATARCGAEIVTHVPSGELLLGRFDLVLALRSLVNLLENACKYSGGAPVELSVRRTGDRLLFEVADRGPGVPPADRERVFQPFYRGHGPTQVPGTGLGLGIARSLARVQGGDVLLLERAGGGSRFVLALPAAELPEGELAPPPAPLPHDAPA